MYPPSPSLPSSASLHSKRPPSPSRTSALAITLDEQTCAAHLQALHSKKVLLGASHTPLNVVLLFRDSSCLGRHFRSNGRYRRLTWRSKPEPIHPSSIPVISAGSQRERRAVSCQFKHSGRLDSSVRTLGATGVCSQPPPRRSSSLVRDGGTWSPRWKCRQQDRVENIQAPSADSASSSAVLAQARRSLSLLEHPSCFIWSTSRFRMFWRIPVVISPGFGIKHAPTLLVSV